MTRFLAVMALSLPLLFTGCAQSEVYDTVYDHKTSVMAGTGTFAANAAAPVGTAVAGAHLGTYVGEGASFSNPLHLTSGTVGGVAGGALGLGYSAGSWVEPHEQDAADITLADAPGFLFGMTDPYQVLPPPFGTAYAPWKLFVTAVRVFPFVTYSDAGEGSTLTMTSGKHAGPLWYAVGPALEDLDSFVSPVHATVAADHTPVPGDGTRTAYLMARFNHQFRNIKHAGYTMKYWFLDANSNLPPYDNYFPDVMSRNKTTILQTLDTFLFNFDWDDPYVP